MTLALVADNAAPAAPVRPVWPMEAEAARDVAAALGDVAVRLPIGSRLRAELLQSARGYCALARLRGVMAEFPVEAR